MPDKTSNILDLKIVEQQRSSPLGGTNKKDGLIGEYYNGSDILAEGEYPNDDDPAWQLYPPPGTEPTNPQVPVPMMDMNAFIPTTDAKPGIYSTHKEEQIDPRFSWLAFQPEYEIIEETNAIPVDYMEDVGTAYVNVSSGNVAGLSPHRDAFQVSPVSQSSSNDPEIIARSYARKYVKFTGKAIRVNHAIPMPTITLIAGKPAYRVGQTRWKQIPIAASATHQVYLAMWEAIYTIDHNGNWSNVFDENLLAQHITQSQVV
jgi:hypothetical protein